MLRKNEKKFYWPKYSEELLKDEECLIVIQINGKKRGIMKMQLDVDENQVSIEAKKIENVEKYIKDKQIIKSVFLKNKLINFIVKE